MCSCSLPFYCPSCVLRSLERRSMGKSLFIAEKPRVAPEFARALKISGKKGDGFIVSETAVVTWCVGHLVTMSYPESYEPALKRWSMHTLPLLPKEF